MIERLTKRLVLGLALILPVTANAATFSIVQITDSQFYAEKHPEILEAQIDWIVANQVAENIIYVAQTGDLKDDGACDNKVVSAGTGLNRMEWDIVNDAFIDLDMNDIPYGVVPGNHDFDPVDTDSDSIPDSCPDYINQRVLDQYNTYFGPGRFAAKPFYGGNRDPANLSNEDNYTLFESGAVKFISINLAYKPAPDGGAVDPELEWADMLLTTNPDRWGIVTSHYLMDTNPGDQLGDYGQEIYDALAGNPNLFMMLAGHWWGEAWSSETAGRPAGAGPVQVMMANYQGHEFPDDGNPLTPPETPDPGSIDFSSLPSFRGGNGATDAGYMRIMRFDTTTGMVDIETFIPPVVPGGKNRTGTPAGADIVSTYTATSGADMNEFTASNLSFTFLGYITLPNGFDIFECDGASGGTCNDLIGIISFPSSSGSQTDGTGITLNYTCNGTFCDSAGYDEGDIQNVDWTLNGSGELTALTMLLDTDPGCLTLTSPLPCSQTSVSFSLISTGLTENDGQGGRCEDPGTGTQCISGIATNGANQFTPH